MRRFLQLIFLLCLCCCLSITAMAATGVTRMQGAATVSADGSCTLSVTIGLHLDNNMTGLAFPLPQEAENVLLNGGYVTTDSRDGHLMVELPNLSAGDYTFSLQYSLPAVVSQGESGPVLTLPLLSGFSYPIQNFEFSVTLPGDITATPTFTSGYHQQEIASSITCTTAGSSLTVVMQQSVKDHETLVMTLPVSDALFPQIRNGNALLDFWSGTVLVCLVLAVAYYLLTLMPQLTPAVRCYGPPDGISAGEVGACLTGTGVDLTMLVISWAQLGYLHLELKDARKVLLHKDMDMGNERSPFEMRVFHALFAGRQSIDGTGLHYARLHRKVALQNPLRQQLFRPRSGDPRIFRALSCAGGAVSGVRLALAMTGHSALQVLLGIVCCLLCAAFSYFLQTGGKYLPLRNKTRLLIGLGCGCVWFALGLLTGRGGATLAMVLFQLICGLAIAFGGRRSEPGKRSLGQIRGLRRYMVRANAFELRQRLADNEQYFYELAPYALALGVDRRFARRFGKTALADCGFLHTHGKQPATAAQWATLLRRVTDLLNERQKKLPYERMTGKIQR